MKSVIAISLFALFSSSYAINDTDVVNAFVDCAIRAATDGVDGLIPHHKDLHIDSVNITQQVLGVDYHFEVTNNMLYNLMDLELRQVDVTTYNQPGTPGALNIDYDIYWKSLKFTGDLAWSAEVRGVKTSGNGTYNIIMEHSHFTGLFNMTKPGQSDLPGSLHVDDFTLNASVKNLTANLTGSVPDWLTNHATEVALYEWFNDVPAYVGEFLKEVRFNQHWIGHPERLTQLVTWCYENPA